MGQCYNMTSTFLHSDITDLIAVVLKWPSCSCSTEDICPSIQQARNVCSLDYCNAVGHP